MHYMDNCSFLCPCGWLSAVLYTVVTGIRLCRNHKQHCKASKALLAKGKHADGLPGAHAQKLMKCPRTNHRMRLKHTSSIVIQNCTGAATRRLRDATICTQVVLGKTHQLLNTCIMHQKLSFNSPLKSVSICLHRPPTSYNMLHQVSSPRHVKVLHTIFIHWSQPCFQGLHSDKIVLVDLLLLHKAAHEDDGSN